MEVQAKKKDDFNAKLSKDHKIQTGGMVLVSDNRHEEFPGKLHIDGWDHTESLTSFQANPYNLKIFKETGLTRE